MTRPTSAAAFHSLKDSGQLAKLQMLVLDYIKAAGPITGRQISRAINGGHKRLRELEILGCIKNGKPVIDPITKIEVMTWESTGQFPLVRISRPKHQTRRQLVEKIIMLEAEVSRLMGLIRETHDACKTLAEGK